MTGYQNKHQIIILEKKIFECPVLNSLILYIYEAMPAIEKSRVIRFKTKAVELTISLYDTKCSAVLELILTSTAIFMQNTRLKTNTFIVPGKISLLFSPTGSIL